MRSTPVARRPRAGADDGFTLMEVIVALALLSIVATAALVFFVNGTRSITTQQRQQAAITVANDAMEDAFSRVPTMSAAGVSGLVVGRTQTDVQMAWSAAGPYAVPGLTDTYAQWDTATMPVALAGISDDAVPLSTSLTHSNVQYDVTTLIGVCYRVTTNPTGPCTKTGGTAAGVPNSGYSPLMRVMVLVTWDDASRVCSTTTDKCSYSTSSMVDPSSDLEWNNTTRLIAADDAVSTDALTPTTIDVLKNDTLMALTSNPVSLLSQPVKASTSTPMGTAVVKPDGSITYTPSADAHGEVTFTYRVTVGARIAQAVVHVYVAPTANNYTVAAVVGTPVSQVVKTSWNATPGHVDVKSQPTSGTLAVSGTSLVYTPAAAGTFAGTYTYSDAEGTSLVGTITFTVLAYTPPSTTNPPAVAVAASATPVPVVMGLQTNTGNPSDYLVKIVALPSVGTVQVDGVNATVGTIGKNVTYTPPPKTAVIATFPVTILTPDKGQESAQVTATAQITPVVASDGTSSAPFQTVPRNTTATLNIGLNDWSFAGTTITASAPVKNGTTTSCGTLTTTSWATNGTVSFKAANTSVTDCRFTYTIKDALGAVSGTATVYLKVS